MAQLSTLKRKQFLPITINEAWRFFSNPANLKLITPPYLGFKILSELPDEIYEGLIIRYKIKPVANLPIIWETEIALVNRPFEFVDIQRRGPYRYWRHHHHFQPVDEGVAMEDFVEYSISVFPFHEILDKIFVSRQLKRIFDFRQNYLGQHFCRA